MDLWEQQDTTKEKLELTSMKAVRSFKKTYEVECKRKRQREEDHAVTELHPEVESCCWVRKLTLRYKNAS